MQKKVALTVMWGCKGKKDERNGDIITTLTTPLYVKI